MIIKTLPYFNDNFCYLVFDQTSDDTALIDCGDAETAIDALKALKRNLSHLLITHHHHDHSGGLTELLNAFPSAQLITIRGENRLPKAARQADDTGVIAFGSSFIKIHLVPAHTRFCTCFEVDGCLFVGDALFSGGCGRLFEGDENDLIKAMDKFSSFPEETRVFFGHEYTLANLAFAKTIEPNNTDLLNYERTIQQKRSDNEYSTPTSIGQEKKINPFLRIDQKEVIQVVDPLGKRDRAERIGELRRKKDRF
ncbi:MAG: hydroxyacylglutathione hydrolase [Deltaproteobacteria bacterium]|nr:hydroxyacylglutathione hydrolase [Deltaproteobacteria bacterium]